VEEGIRARGTKKIIGGGEISNQRNSMKNFALGEYNANGALGVLLDCWEVSQVEIRGYWG